MKRKIYVICAIILILVLIIIFAIKKVYIKDKEIENYEKTLEEQADNQKENNIEEIEKIKKEINSNANTDIYQIEEEFDGRRILQIRHDVQFKVDLAGIIKNAKPQENEIDNLIQKKPTGNGIWISQQSRNSFLELLKNNNIGSFYITNEGFLCTNIQNIENTIEKELESMIKSDKQYIINMSGVSYERDYISGQIVEYPFEDMDPFQVIEPYMLENSLILEVTSNKNKKVTDKEILEAIIQYK